MAKMQQFMNKINGNGDGNGNGNGKGDPKAFGGKKGDKSKTHSGRDFEKSKLATKAKSLKSKK